MMNKRTFTQEEKLRIIKEASEQGVKVILEKYDLYPATYYSWKSKLEEMGEIGLQHGMTPKHCPVWKDDIHVNFTPPEISCPMPYRVFPATEVPGSWRK